MDKNNKSVFMRYLIYNLKKNFIQTIIILALCLLYISQLPSIISPYYNNYHIDCGIELLRNLLCLICPLIVFLEFAPMNNRRTLDMLYSAPISRFNLSAVKFISGFARITFIYTVVFITYLGYVLITSPTLVNGYTLLFYIVSLLLAFVIYSFFAFLFTQANTTFDGVFFCLSWILLILAILFAIPFTCQYFIENTENSYFDKILYSVVFAPLIGATTLFEDLIEQLNKNSSSDYITRFAFGCLFWSIVSLLSVFGYFKHTTKKQSYKSGEKSTSAFGYKLIIPAYGFSLLIICSSSSGVLWNIVSAVVFVSMIIGYIIYRRGFKFKISDIISLTIALLLLIYTYLH